VKPNSVLVSATILETKEVPIHIEEIKDVPTGYSLEGLTCVPEKVVVKGTRESLSSFSAITIPAEEIDLSQASDDTEFSINITQYLPEGIDLLDLDQGTVVVTADLEPMQEKTFVIPVNQLKVLNLNPAYDIVFEQSAITITVQGMQDVLDELTVEDLGAYIDMKDYTDGNFSVLVSRNPISGVIDTQIVYVSGSIVLKRIENESIPEIEDGSEENSETGEGDEGITEPDEDASNEPDADGEQANLDEGEDVEGEIMPGTN